MKRGRFKSNLSKGGWWLESQGADFQPLEGKHLGRDGGRARHWIFGFIVAAILLVMFASTQWADRFVVRWGLMHQPAFEEQDDGQSKGKRYDSQSGG